jgi:UDP-glucose 4-epimerase
VKYFISGIGGFLGSHLGDQLLKLGHTVAGCDNLVGGDKDNVPKNTAFYEVDCTNLHEMSWIMSKEKPDVVYHTAAYPHEGLSVFSPKTITDSVYSGSVAVMTAAIQSNVKRVINTSSMARYGHQDTLPFTETMTCKPVDPYGIAKLAAEDTMRILAKVHNVEFVNAIPHNISGSRQRFWDPFRNVIAIMCNRMMQGKQPIIYGDGMQKRCFSHIDDDLPVFLEMGNLSRKDIIGESFNVGPDEEFVTINELAEAIAFSLSNFKLDPIYMPDRPQEVKHANCSSDKIRRYFGFKTKNTLMDIISDVIGYIELRGGPRSFSYHLPLEIHSDKMPKTWSNRMM